MSHAKSKPARGSPKVESVVTLGPPGLKGSRLYTESQMLEAIQDGLRQGWQDGWTEMLKTVYAATAYVMRHEYGWGAMRLTKLMDEIDQRVYTTINHADLVEQLDEEYRIYLDLEDLIHRIVILGPGPGRPKKKVTRDAQKTEG